MIAVNAGVNWCDFCDRDLDDHDAVSFRVVNDEVMAMCEWCRVAERKRDAARVLPAANWKREGF